MSLTGASARWYAGIVGHTFGMMQLQVLRHGRPVESSDALAEIEAGKP
jgi:hypothetical protein